ncbi:hypothetical protein ACQ86F_10040 [Streptomyces venezuelae ATCC 10712]
MTPKTSAAAIAGRFQPRTRVPWVVASPNSSSAGSPEGSGPRTVPSMRVRSSRGAAGTGT